VSEIRQAILKCPNELPTKIPDVMVSCDETDAFGIGVGGMEPLITIVCVFDLLLLLVRKERGN